MADLPIELWHSVFDHLEDLADLYSCARVCKALYLEVKAYRIREIAFTRGAYEWLHYCKTITNHKYQTDYQDTSILRRSSFNFDYLRHLTISGRSSFDLNEINRFVHLEQLDIDLTRNQKKLKSTISLANLKVLYVFVPPHRPCLELDTPRLAKVCTFSLEKLEFIYPESIRCIHTFTHGEKLSMFQNLEYLLFTDNYDTLYETIQNVENFSLQGLEKLKEIDFFYRRPLIEKENIETFKRITENLLTLGRPDLKVFWLNVQVTDPRLLNEFIPMYDRTHERTGVGTCGPRIVFQLQHSEKLKGKVDFLEMFEFDQSMRELSRAGFDQRSEEFISKFLAVFSFRGIAIRGRVFESELLMELIAGSPNLSRLEFRDIGLDQSFFDRMADTIQLKNIPLRSLYLVNFFPKKSNESLNFDFVLKLQHLQRFEAFETHLHLPNELVLKLLQLPVLDVIESSSNEAAMSIERVSRVIYRLDDEEELSLKEVRERFSRKISLQNDIESDSVMG